MFAHPHPYFNTIFITSPYRSVERQIFNITFKTHYYIADRDTEPETLFMHANNHRRWRIAQTIERSGFNLCFGLYLYELLDEFY